MRSQQISYEIFRIPKLLEDDLLSFEYFSKTDNRLLIVNFSIDDIAKILQNLEPNKAHGHEKIT